MNFEFTIFGLLIAHYLGDFSHLSRPYMLKAKLTGSPLMPIFEHAAVHAILVSIVVYLSTGQVLLTAICFTIELCSHFAIDTLKGRLNVRFPQLMSTRSYGHWYVFGADQLLHVLVLILITRIVNG